MSVWCVSFEHCINCNNSIPISLLLGKKDLSIPIIFQTSESFQIPITIIFNNHIIHLFIHFHQFQQCVVPISISIHQIS